LGRDGLRLIQHADFFPFTSDVYLLAAFARPGAGQAVLELGCGSGAVLILLAARTSAGRLNGLEIQPALADLARRNVALNNLADRVEIIQHDLRREIDPAPERFDLVVANPPYLPADAGSHSKSRAMLLAKHEITCDLHDVVQAGLRWLKDRGRLVLVHRAQRLPEILAELAATRLQPKRLTLVYPRPGTAATSVLVEARVGARPGLDVGPPLFVREAGGGFSPEMEEIFAGRWPG